MITPVKRQRLRSHDRSVSDIAPSPTPLVKRDTSGLVSAAQARLDALDGLKLKIGVIRMWPDQAVAEHENVERLRIAGASIGVEIVELDRYGNILASPGSQVTEYDVDFVLHLHFETAKTYDAPSVAAMWNPLSFYFEWGYGTYWPNQMSHDLFAFTGPGEIRDLVERERGAGFVEQMPLLNHTLADPIYASGRHKQLRAFYCGINWEKINGKPGRHDDVLRSLDAVDRMAIYGPEKVQGVKVWDNFNCYRGSLPFDGQTIIGEIAKAGACLVFSSDAHKASGIMSNRLFEALSGGAVVIGDEHPFIRQAIGDDFVEVPARWPAEQRVKTILDALEELERDPAQAAAMAQRGQDRLMESYFLTTQIVSLFETVSRFRQSRQRRLAAISSPIVDIVVQPLHTQAGTSRVFLHELSRKLGQRANIIVLCRTEHAQWYRETFGRFCTIIEAEDATSKEVLAPVEAVRLVRPALRSSKVWFSFMGEEIFATDFLLGIEAFTGCAVGRFSHLLKHFDNQGTKFLDFRSGELTTERLNAAAWSSCLFDVEWLLARVRPATLSWQQCARIAEVEEQRVAFTHAPAVVIDLKHHEQAIAEGYTLCRLEEPIDLETRIGPVRSPLSAEAGTKSYRLAPPSYDIDVGETVDFSAKHASALSPILGIGWSSLEATHIWSIGERSELNLQIPPTVSKIFFDISGNPHVPGRHQRVAISVNGKPVSEVACEDGGHATLEIDSSQAPWRAGLVNRIVLQVSPAAKPPLDSGDERQLGCCLWKMRAV